jgi:hypothetical protein
MPQFRGLHWRGPTLSAALLCALVPIVWGQEAVVRGRVSDDRGESLATAAVEVVELGLAAYSGSDGRYAITIPAPRVSGQLVTLRARLIGHKAAMRRITLSPGEQTLDFALATDVNQLETVVVTGVSQATEQVKVPFSVTRIEASALLVPATDPLRELQGKIPANIVSSSGRPGGQPAVLLRGPTSLNAEGRSQDPLYIVDGVIINGSRTTLRVWKS